MRDASRVRPTGHLQVKGKRGSRSFYALIRDADGRHQRRLGPAWVKDSGQRTTRGAVKWVTRDGSKPDGYLSPADAQDMLLQMLAGASRRRPARASSATKSMTLRQACDHWLRWAEVDSEVERSTLGDYSNSCNRICRDLGAQTPVAQLTRERIERWLAGFSAERRLSEGEATARRAKGAEIRRLADGTYLQLTVASPRTKRKYLVNLNGILVRAMKLGAISTNPVSLVDRPGRLRKRRSLATSQFLRPAEVHALVRAAAASSEQDAIMFMLSAFCGLRLGELLDLRWGAINFAGSAIHVESSFVRNASRHTEVGRRTRRADGAGGCPDARQALDTRPAGIRCRPRVHGALRCPRGLQRPAQAVLRDTRGCRPETD